MIDFFSIIKFALFLLIALFVPGYVLTKLAKISQASSFFLAIPVGFCLAALSSYLANWLFYFVVSFSLLIFIIKGYLKDLKMPKWNLEMRGLILVILITAGVIFQNNLTFRSGLHHNNGVDFWGPLGHDGVWHQALVNQLTKKVPPTNPGLSGTALTNYHYYYDLLVAQTARFTGVSVSDLIYRFYPFIFSLLLGIGTYLVSRGLFKQRLAAPLALFMVYFGGSFGWVVEWLRERHLGGESAFWANQPVSMNLNPPFAISLVLVIALMLAFQSFEKSRDNWTAIVITLLAGTLIEFKVYAGVVVLSSLGLVALVKILTKKDFSYLKLFIPASLLSLIVFLPNNSQAAGLIVFSPLWLVHSMVDFSDRVGWVRLSQARQAYFARGEWLKYLGAEGLGLLLFIAGNLGTRVIALFSELKKDNAHLFIILMGTVSLILPLVFIQKGNPWNTIQFMYYFLYIASLFAGAALAKMLTGKLPKVVSIGVLGVILLITPVSSFATFRSAFYDAPSRLTEGELEALNFLRSQPEGFVLTHPYNKELREGNGSPYPLSVYETSAYVSAFSGKQTFVEDEFQQEIFQNDYKGRLADANTFFYGNDYSWDMRFLSDNKIAYIYLPKLYGVGVNENQVGVEKIFSNLEAEVYKVGK